MKYLLEDFREARASFKAKRKKMHFSLPAQIYSAPNYLNEATYTVRGTLLIDTNKSVIVCLELCV